MKGSLVQIHYHNRPGGVAAVMGHYCRAFREACGGHGACVMVCARDRHARPDAGVKIVNVKECGYRTFTSAASFRAAGRLLLARLGSIIADPSLPRPVIVAGHNLPLCKNAALSHAFAGLARDFARTGDDVRFISVVHDFAEQGRTDLMTQAHLLERRGIRIWDALYPDLSNLRFAAVSASARYVLRKAGFRACLVPNAVIAPNGRTTASACTRGKSIRAHRNIDNRDPVLFYPGRIISRKNPVEALVLSHVFFSSTLVLGEDGTSAADRALYQGLQALCTRYKVRAVFAGARRAGDAEGGYSRLYSNADACVSTSVLEGFGYGLREPWLYGRAVIGRLPCGIAQVEIPGGAGLYKRFLVPKEWIDVEALKRLYLRQMRLCFGSRSATDSAGAFSKAFNREFVRGNGLDFGCLDIATQCAVFEAVCRSGALAEQWKNAFPGQTLSLAKSLEEALHPSTGSIAAKQRQIEAGHGRAAFASSLAACFGKQRAAPASTRPDCRRIQRHFCSLAQFRLLAAPQAPGARHCCTVSP